MNYSIPNTVLLDFHLSLSDCFRAGSVCPPCGFCTSMKGNSTCNLSVTQREGCPAVGGVPGGGKSSNTTAAEESCSSRSAGREPGLQDLLLLLLLFLLLGSRMEGQLPKERQEESSQAAPLHHGQSRGAESSSRGGGGGGHHQRLHGPILHPLSRLINLLVFPLQSPPHRPPEQEGGNGNRFVCYVCPGSGNCFFKGSRLFRGKNPCVSVYVCYESRSSLLTRVHGGPPDPQQQQEQLPQRRRASQSLPSSLTGVTAAPGSSTHSSGCTFPAASAFLRAADRGSTRLSIAPGGTSGTSGASGASGASGGFREAAGHLKVFRGSGDTKTRILVSSKSTFLVCFSTCFIN